MAHQGFRWRSTPLTIIIVYLLVSGVWILVSDRLLGVFVTDPEAFARDQTYKGWFFVVVTAVLLYGMIQRHTRALLQTQAQLREREAWYRRLITTAEEGIWVLDTEQRTTFVNQHIADMLGYRIDEMLGRSAYDFIDPAWHENFTQHMQSRQQGAHEIYEVPLRARDGTERWAIASAAPIFDDAGNFQGAFAMYTDITGRHQAEEFQREFARKTIEAATDGKLLICTREEIETIAGPPITVVPITRSEDLEVTRHAVTEAALAMGIEEERVFDFTLCVSEATTNALKHAGSGMFSLHRTDDSLMAIIADNGPGISAINLPEVALKPGYSTGVSLGMGYKAMISMADKVYLCTGPGGTTVAIIMGKHAPKQATVTIPKSLGGW